MNEPGVKIKEWSKNNANTIVTTLQAFMCFSVSQKLYLNPSLHAGM
jgi:hypothetical protein